MKDTVDRLSAELTQRYIHYLDIFLVDLWSGDGFIEFRCGFSLRTDHVLRHFKLKLPAIVADTDNERALAIVIIFEQIQYMVDKAIAEDKTAAH